MTARRKSGPRGQAATRYLTVRITPSVRRLLRAAARTVPCSVTDYVLEAALERVINDTSGSDPELARQADEWLLARRDEVED